MTGVGEFSGTIVPGRYRIVRPLSASGRLYEARHERASGSFALELHDGVDVRAFQRGVQSAGALHHPAIAKIVDHGTTSGRAFVVMEWTAGRSLDVLRAERGSLAPAEVVRIVDGVALGLQAAHRQGLAHGHLAPDRVLALDDVRSTKILGFGLDPADLRARAFGAARDTPYTAPERLANGASALADQFSLGAIAYELLTGAPPDADLAARRPPRSVREYDPTIGVEVDEVIQRALYFDPRARWADVHTFAQRLREAADAENAREERTRLAPLPLTVSRPTQSSGTPTPIQLPPVIASVDVDLRTPSPLRLRPILQGAISMNPPSHRPPPPAGPPAFPRPMPPMTSTRPATRAPTSTSPSQPFFIQPTPTFSFADEPAPGPLYKPRRRSGGRFLFALLVIGAGAAGYLTVQGHSWHELEPLAQRAIELGRSLRTLAPGASPEVSPPAAAPAAPPAATPAQAAAPAAPSTVPEVVPIPPATPPAKEAARASSARAHHATRVHRAPKRTGGDASSTELSDEAATEEALLAGPSGGR